MKNKQLLIDNESIILNIIEKATGGYDCHRIIDDCEKFIHYKIKRDDTIVFAGVELLHSDYMFVIDLKNPFKVDFYLEPTGFSCEFDTRIYVKGIEFTLSI